MVAIAPFCALRYNLDVVGDLSAVVAPPYDVITPQDQEQLYQASPYNIIRLILGKELPTDRPDDNRYTRAKQTFDDWRAERILIQDDVPAIYLYEHAFTWEGRPFRRLGCVALLEFAAQAGVPDGVLAHEATFEAPKADRTRLLDAVHANLSPIFCIAPDDGQQAAALLRRVSQTQQPLTTTSVRGEAVRLWALTDPRTIRTLTDHLAGAPVLIADGHHRFAVALSRRQWCGAVMSYFAWLDDPAVLVHPIHRVVTVAPGVREAWRSRLRALCSLVPSPSLDSLVQWVAGSEPHGRFGYYEQGQGYQATLHERVLAEWLMRPSVPLALAGLDVTLLHQLLLPKLVEAEAPPSIRYTPHPAQAVAMADAGAGECAVLLRGIPLEQVFALAAQGLTLPQKSTYFYPKLLSGLVIHPFEPASSFVKREA